MQQGPDMPTILWMLLTRGVPDALQLTFFGLAMGFAIGLTLALMRVYGTEEMGWIAESYEKVLRGVPVLVLIYIFTFGASSFFWFVDPIQRPLVGAYVALGIRSGAYQSQIFRGAILSVSEGQVMAARALGMTNIQTQLYVVLPQAFRMALPAWSNEYAVVIKDSSFASAVGVFEILKVVQNITANHPELWLPSMGIVTLIYFVFTYPVTRYFGKKQKGAVGEFGREVIWV